MHKVYLQAAALALAGLGLAVADRALRSTPTVESPAPGPSGTNPAAPPTGPVTPPKPTPPKPTPADPTPPNPEPVNPAPPNPAPVTPPQATPAVKVDPAALPVKISLAQAFALYSAGASFIDGRKPDEFAAGHVQDSINLRNDDVQQNNQAWQDFFQSASLDSTTYVVYCYGKDCHEADQLRETLAAVGFKKVYVMEASFEEWKAAGHP